MMPEAMADQPNTTQGTANDAMEVKHLNPDTIEVGDRMRGLDQDCVAALVDSIRKTGLQAPIIVYAVQHDDGFTHRLIAGRHRLEAIKALRWNQIDCFVTTADEHDRQLIEIDENLIRAELTELERAQHLKRRKEIFDAKGGKKIPTPGGEQTVGFDKDTADKTGMSKRAVNKSRNRAEKIDPEVQEDIKDTPIADKGVELDALADMAPDDQKQAVAMVRSGKAASVREAVKATVREPHKKKRRGRNATQERAAYWRKLKEALENVNGMPDVTTIINTVPAAKREMVTNHLPFVTDWLDDFRAEWTIKQAGTGDQDDAAIELRAIGRAWDRISDDTKKAFVAELKTRGSL